MRFAGAALLTSLLLACPNAGTTDGGGSGGSSGSGGSGGGTSGTGGGSGGIPVEQAAFCPALHDALCEYWVRCGVYGTMNGCLRGGHFWDPIEYCGIDEA